MLRIVEGDENAFRQLFDIYRDRLFVFAERMIKSKVDAEEIVQDTFINVWMHKEILNSVEHPEQWLYSITRNKTIDYIRKATKNELLLNKIWANLSQTDNALEDKITLKDYELLVARAVAALTPQQQHIYQLSRSENLTHEQIAERMGLSKSRVKNIIVEILKQIRVYLIQYSDLAAVFFLDPSLSHYGLKKIFCF